MRYLIAIITGAILLSVIFAVQLDRLHALFLDPGDAIPVQTASLEASRRTASPPHVGAASAPQAQPDEKISLDIARISQTGPSVFAGRAAAFAHVIVLDGTTVIGTAVADSGGEWTMVTEYRFATHDPRIHFRIGDGSDSAAALPVSDTGSDDHPQFRDPAAQLLSRFETVVATAREAAKRPVQAHGSFDEHKISSDVPKTIVAELSATAPSSAAATPAPFPVAEPASIPIPMTFVYNEATLTSEGRRGANLLLEYLNLKKFADVTLTGHADERGLPNYNMELSRQRLLVIEQLLRHGGYQGQLDLVPKGSTEPYKGVDRSRYPYEDLMQLDRRVELRNVH